MHQPLHVLYQKERRIDPRRCLQHTLSTLLKCLLRECRVFLHCDLVLLQNHRDHDNAFELCKTATQAGAYATAEWQEGVPGPVTQES